MRILFAVTQYDLLRHFDTVLLRLAERGHSICLAAERHDRTSELPPELARHDRISQSTCPDHRDDEWQGPIATLRGTRDYLRYLDKRFARAPKLRQRALRSFVKQVTNQARSHASVRCPACHTNLVDEQWGQVLAGLGSDGLASLDALLQLTEATVPSDLSYERFTASHRPDIVLVTPLVKFGSYQAELVKSAQALGIPVGFPVFSWDNLTTKGLIHVMPDRVFVWNDVQRGEAVKLHHVPKERVVVTGAPRFDDFFAMSPKTTREQYCASFALDPAKPLLAYLCSSEFVAEAEVDFVVRWVREVRAHPELAGCNILVRPHPRVQAPWRTSGAELGLGVAVAFPHGLNADQSLFDLLHHSAAVVGLNTSAQLEAAIVGRPVHTVLADEFAAGQQGTLHFRYLLHTEGGFVEMSPDFETHRQQLAAAVRGEYDAEAIRAFAERFLRPSGLNRPATPIMVKAIERFARECLAPRGQAAAL